MMKKRFLPLLGMLLVTALLVSACSKPEKTSGPSSQGTVMSEENKSNEEEALSGQAAQGNRAEESTVVGSENEEEAQLGQGINGPLPDPDYTYQGIVDSVGGICKFPSVYEKNYQENVEKWRDRAKEEVRKIEKKCPEGATEEEIQDLFKQFLYISAYDYPAIEPIERYSYVIFKKDKEDPFTHKKIQENFKVNLEIALDCSGSMAKVIGGKSMMEIAKASIQKVLAQMPKDAQVGLRVFGHKGNNEASGKKESCAACELIRPIQTLNVQEIAGALQPVAPTGWTCLAKSIEGGAQDLATVTGEKTLNILYIVTDGIETCGGKPVEVAAKLKGGASDIVLGIIGFNVNAGQNRVLKEIADAAGGYYASAKDAGELTDELQKVHELAYSSYQWEELDQSLLNELDRYQTGALLHNKLRFTAGPITEKNAITSLISFAGAPDVGLIQPGGQVEKKLRALAEERFNKITTLMNEEYAKREQESKAYRAFVAGKKGETVAFIPTTSRVNPDSNYFTGYSNQGGDTNGQQQDTKRLEEQINPKK